MIFKPTTKRKLSRGQRMGLEELRGQEVVFIRNLANGMIRVRFPSDFEMDCYPEELVDTPAQKIALIPFDEYTERAGTLLVDEDGGMVAWLTIKDNLRIEISWQKDNYPSLRVTIMEKTEKKLAAHIRKNCKGWYAKKLNVEGVKLKHDSRIA
jgi:hypothetical protein